MNTLLKLAFFLLPMIVFSQSECYDASFDFSGFDHDVSDSMQIVSCSLGELMPEGVSSNFKVFSTFNYHIGTYTTETQAYNESVKREVSSLNQYNLLFLWSSSRTKMINTATVEFTFPNDREFNNCFTDIKIRLIEAKTQRLLNELIVAANDAPEEFRTIELKILKKLKIEMNKVVDCCYSNKIDEECSSCLTDSDLIILKGDMDFLELQTDADVSFGYDPIQESGTDTLNFISYNTNTINIGGGAIDVFDLYAEYVSLYDVNLSHPVLLTDDASICQVDFNRLGNSDYSWINITGNSIEMSVKFDLENENSTSFAEFVIDRNTDYFGYLVNDVKLENGELFPVDDNAVESLFTGTGAIISIFPNRPGLYELNDVYLSSSEESGFLFGALYSFTVGITEYKAIMKKGESTYLGYYATDVINESQNVGGLLTTKNIEANGQRFSEEYPSYLAIPEVNGMVAALKKDNSLTSLYSWSDVSDVQSTIGDEGSIFIPSFVIDEFNPVQWVWNYIEIAKPNLLIIIADFSGRPYSTEDIMTNNENWNMTCVRNLFNADVAIQEMYSKFGFSHLENVIVRQHGSATHFRASSNNQLKAEDIRLYIEDVNAPISQVDKKNIESLIYIANQINDESEPGSLYFYGCDLGSTLALDPCLVDSPELAESECVERFYTSFMYAFSSLMVKEDIRNSAVYMNINPTRIKQTEDKEYITMGWELPATRSVHQPKGWNKIVYGGINLQEADLSIHKSGEPIRRVE